MKFIINYEMKKFFIFYVLFLLCPVLLFSQGFNVQNFYPSTDGGNGITGYSSRVGDPWNFNILTMITYTASPLEMGINRDETRKVIPYMVTSYWGTSLNLPYNFQSFLLLPWDTYVKISDPLNDIYKRVSSVGDIRFGVKYSFFNRSHYPGGALILRGIVPSGSPEYYLGNPDFELSATAVGDYEVSGNYFYLNLSYTFRRREEIMNLSLDDELNYVMGYSYPSGGDLFFTVELNGKTVLRHFFKYESLNPVEVNVMFKKREKKFEWGIVGGTGLTKGIGSPDYRVGILITYPPSTYMKFTEVKPVVTEKKCLSYFLLPPSKQSPSDPCYNAEYGYIRGRVASMGGFPIGKCRVLIQPGNMLVDTDNQGNFLVKLKPGIYYLKALKKNFTSTEVFIELKEKSVRDVTLKIKYLEGKLIIRLYSPTLTPLAAVVSIYSGTRLLKRYSISERGAMLSLPPGEYVVVGEFHGFRKVSKIVEIKPGVTTEADLIFK